MQENDYFIAIEGLIINNEVNKSVKNYMINKTDLETKYNIGKLLSEAGKHYGEGIIKNYSIKLTQEFGKGYDTTSLKRMRQFYLTIQKGAPLAHQLSWSHYQELLSIKNINIMNYYINLSVDHKLSRNALRERIKSKEYERLPESTKLKLINKEETNIKDSIPEPILIPIKDLDNKKIVNEKALHKFILENIEEFMKYLGNGYSFIGSEYQIKIGNKDNYIDILLFNVIQMYYVVLELKVTELKKEYFGQIEVYKNYIDKHLKTENMNKTIGILLVKENNEYVLYSSDGNIITRTYELTGGAL